MDAMSKDVALAEALAKKLAESVGGKRRDEILAEKIIDALNTGFLELGGDEIKMTAQQFISLLQYVSNRTEGTAPQAKRDDSHITIVRG
jgi:hypothetical protein